MWPILYNVIRANAVYITAPVAAVVGFIGYNLENLISDKYTPYNSEYIGHNATLRLSIHGSTLPSGSIQETRAERLSDDSVLLDPTRVEKLRLNENVLGRNLSPSLQQHQKQ